MDSLTKCCQGDELCWTLGKEIGDIVQLCAPIEIPALFFASKCVDLMCEGEVGGYHMLILYAMLLIMLSVIWLLMGFCWIRRISDFFLGG